MQSSLPHPIEQGLQAIIRDGSVRKIKHKTVFKPFAETVLHDIAAMTGEVQKLAPACKAVSWQQLNHHVAIQARYMTHQSKP